MAAGTSAQSAVTGQRLALVLDDSAVAFLRLAILVLMRKLSSAFENRSVPIEKSFLYISIPLKNLFSARKKKISITCSECHSHFEKLKADRSPHWPPVRTKASRTHNRAARARADLFKARLCYLAVCLWANDYFSGPVSYWTMRILVVK